MIRVLGIDPGSRVTGFGLVEFSVNRAVYIASGGIRAGGDNLTERLKQIFHGVGEVITTYAPTEVAIEAVFMHRNAGSALKLGQARGAAIVAAVQGDLPVFEYSATQIKQATTGRGRATKEQVQHMVKVLLSLTAEPQSDAADALAVALCHHHTSETLRRMRPSVTAGRGGGW